MPKTREPVTEEKKRFQLATFGPKKPVKICKSPDNNISQFPELKDHLPTGYDYHVCEYDAISETEDRVNFNDHVNFNATLRMGLSSTDEIARWLKSHVTTWRVARTTKVKGGRVVFRVEYRCQHKQVNRTPRRKQEKDNLPGAAVPRRSKNTDCSAKMVVTLHAPLRTECSRGRPSINSDPHLPAFPTKVRLHSDHNHNLKDEGALRYRDVGDEAKATLIKYFEAGHSPTTALDMLKLDLLEKHGDDYERAAANGELCPKLEFCYRFYHKLFDQEYESPVGVEMTVARKRKVEGCNVETGSDGAIANEEADVHTWSEEPDVEMAEEEAELSASQEASCQAAAAGLAKMCEDLVAKIRRDPSLAAPALAAAEAFQRVKTNPRKIATALNMFSRYINTSTTTSVRSKAQRAQLMRQRRAAGQASVKRRKPRLGGKRRIVAGRLSMVTTGHLYTQPSKRPRTLAPP